MMDESDHAEVMGNHEEAVVDISVTNETDDADVINTDTFISPTKQQIQHHDNSKKKTVKKPLTSFIYYMGAQREIVMKENPELKFGEIGKKIGESFKLLTPEEREHYDNLAKQDKERYIRELEEFKAHSALHPEEYAPPSNKLSDSTITIPVVSVFIFVYIYIYLLSLLTIITMYIYTTGSCTSHS